MDIAYHPLKDPSLGIPVVATNVKSGIELQQKLFIPMLFISDKPQKANISEAVEGFFQAGQANNGFAVWTHMGKDAPLIV